MLVDPCFFVVFGAVCETVSRFLVKEGILFLVVSVSLSQEN